MAEIAFYTNPMSRGRIARWMLHEAGADYEQHVFDYGEQMKSAEYRRINPMGKVPAIVHRGRVVTECAAICAYLAEAFPAAGLLPGGDERADYFRWLFFAAGPVDQAIANKMMGFSPADDQQVMAGYGNYDLVVEVLDQLLSDRTYICGERFTAADVYVGSQIDWGTRFDTLPQRPNFVSYADRLRAREAYQAAMRIDEELVAQRPDGK